VLVVIAVIAVIALIVELTRSQLRDPGGATGTGSGNTRALPTNLQRDLPRGVQRNSSHNVWSLVD